MKACIKSVRQSCRITPSLIFYFDPAAFRLQATPELSPWLFLAAREDVRDELRAREEIIRINDVPLQGPNFSFRESRTAVILDIRSL